MRLPDLPDPLTLDPATVDNAVLRRLITEVQQELGAGRRAYDRIHQRHNRGVAPRPPAREPEDLPVPEAADARTRRHTMAQPHAHRPRHRDEVQNQRHAAVQAIARERVLRDALDELDPQPEDMHLDYGELVQRLSDVLGEERRRLGEE